MKFRVSTNTVAWIEAESEDEAIIKVTNLIEGFKPNSDTVMSVEDVYDVTEIEEEKEEPK